MARPSPEYVARIKAMKTREVIVIETEINTDTVRFHCRSIPGRFKVKRYPDCVTVTKAPEKTPEQLAKSRERVDNFRRAWTSKQQFED